MINRYRFYKTGVTCEAGNAHSSVAPDFTLQWRVHVVPFYLPILPMSGQAFYRSTIWVLFASIYGLLLTLMNVYWDEAPMLFVHVFG